MNEQRMLDGLIQFIAINQLDVAKKFVRLCIFRWPFKSDFLTLESLTVKISKDEILIEWSQRCVTDETVYVSTKVESKNNPKLKYHLRFRIRDRRVSRNYFRTIHQSINSLA